MGLDVTYHPFAPSEVRSLYFDQLGDGEAARRLAQTLELDEDRAIRLQIFLSEGCRDHANKVPFHEGHANSIAIISGLIRKYWYFQKCRFSTLLSYPAFRRYVVDWRELVPEGRYRDEFTPGNKVCRQCGIFLSPDGLKQLRADYQANELVRSRMDQVFPRGWLPIFWKAVDYAIERDLGLIEAVDLDAPNQYRPVGSQGLVPVCHRDAEGVVLYNQESLARARTLFRWRDKKRRAQRQAQDRADRLRKHSELNVSS